MLLVSDVGVLSPTNLLQILNCIIKEEPVQGRHWQLVLLLQFCAINFFFRLLYWALGYYLLLRHVALRPCNNIIVFEHLMHLVMLFGETTGILDID